MLERERGARDSALEWGGASSLDKTLGGASRYPYTTAPSITEILTTIIGFFSFFFYRVYLTVNNF
jgi:hypothetical protein